LQLFESLQQEGMYIFAYYGINVIFDPDCSNIVAGGWMVEMAGKSGMLHANSAKVWLNNSESCDQRLRETLFNAKRSLVFPREFAAV
jgi:hypothetical protein